MSYYSHLRCQSYGVGFSVKHVIIELLLDCLFFISFVAILTKYIFILYFFFFVFIPFPLQIPFQLFLPPLPFPGNKVFIFLLPLFSFFSSPPQSSLTPIFHFKCPFKVLSFPSCNVSQYPIVVLPYYSYY